MGQFYYLSWVHHLKEPTSSLTGKHYFVELLQCLIGFQLDRHDKPSQTLKVQFSAPFTMQSCANPTASVREFSLPLHQWAEDLYKLLNSSKSSLSLHSHQHGNISGFVWKWSNLFLFKSNLQFRLISSSISFFYPHPIYQEPSSYLLLQSN